MKTEKCQGCKDPLAGNANMGDSGRHEGMAFCVGAVSNFGR
jgi:hypothetical protein